MLDKFRFAATILASDPRYFLSLVLTVVLPGSFLIAVATHSGLPEANGLTDQTRALIGLFLPISTGALLYAVALKRRGETSTYREAMGFGLRIWLRLLVARFVADLLIRLGVVALVIPGIILYLAYSLIEAAVVVEGTGVNASRARSFRLTKGMRWRLLRAQILYGLGLLVLAVCVFFPLYSIPLLDNIFIRTLAEGVYAAAPLGLTVVLFFFYVEATDREAGAETEACPSGSLNRAISVKSQLIYAPWIFLVLVVHLIPALRSVAYDWNDVPTRTMNPTVLAGDRVLINKCAYDWRIPFTQRSLIRREDPAPGDLVVFNSPEDGGRLLKRIVATPEDVIEIREYRLIINGSAAAYDEPDYDELDAAATLSAGGPSGGEEALVEVLDGHRHSILIHSTVHPHSSFGPYQIPEGHYFVLGDRRSNSRDSRHFGPVPRSAVLGRVEAVVLSFDLDRSGVPRWERFFTALH